jgi:hypothetical protein
MDIDGALTMYSLSGPILAAQAGPFARVKDGAACAVLLPAPGPVPAAAQCEPPGRLLRLFLGSDDNRVWRAEVRVDDAGMQFVRVERLDGTTAWVAASAVEYAAEYLLGGQ